jgi:hypothetical protein
MQKLVSRLGAVIAVTASTLLLSGCYVTSGPSYRHHPAHCKRVERVKRVCVRSHKGHCKRWKRRTHVRYHC